MVEGGIRTSAKRYVDLNLLVVAEARGDVKKPILAGYNTPITPQDSFDFHKHLFNDKNNISIRTGHVVCVVDVDNKGDNIRQWDAYVEASGGDPVTWKVKSGGGGYHYYFQWEDDFDVLSSKHYTLENSDVVFEFKGTKAKITAPPSIHKSGLTYTWERDPWTTPLAKLPQWLLRPMAYQNTVDNDTSPHGTLDDQDISLFKESPYWQSFLRPLRGKDNHGRISFKAPLNHNYDCKVCRRTHYKNSNTPFLWKNDEGVFFTCRYGQKGGTALIKSFVEPLQKCETWAETAQYIIDYIMPHNHYVSVKDNRFFCFNGVHWREDKNSGRIYRLIIEDLVSRYKSVIKACDRKISTLQEVMGKLDKEKKEEAENVLKNLKNQLSTAKDNLIRVQSKAVIQELTFHLSKKLYNHDFLDQLDSNPDLIAFDDGVYDLEAKQFRQARPEDMLSFSVGFDFPVTDYGYEDKIKTFFVKVYPDKELRQYVLTDFAQALSGRQRTQCFTVHTGRGANGKSVLCRLLLSTFGDYASDIPSSVITQRNTQTHSTGNPILHEMRGRRIIYYVEAKNTDKLNDEIIKKATGGDQQKYRLLYENEIRKYYPQSHHHLFSNRVPDCDGQDGGMRRRLRIVPYKSRFVTEDQVDESKHCYLRDADLEHNIHLYNRDFMRMLISAYNPKYIDNPPSIVLKHTEDYLDENNMVKDFVSEFIVVTNNTKYNKETGKPPDYITIKEIRHRWIGERKPHIKESDLKKCLIDELPDVPFRASGKVKISDTEGKQYRDVRSFFLGIRWIEDEQNAHIPF